MFAIQGGGKLMLIKVSCEYCGNEDLIMSDCIVGFYCNKCDEDLTTSEIEIEEIKEMSNKIINIENVKTFDNRKSIR